VPKHTKYCATPPTPKLREEKVVTCFQEAINNTGIDSNEPRFTRLELPSISLQKEEWQYICLHTRCKRGVSSQGIPPQSQLRYCRRIAEERQIQAQLAQCSSLEINFMSSRPFETESDFAWKRYDSGEPGSTKLEEELAFRTEPDFA
jgi:hypothetical protein